MIRSEVLKTLIPMISEELVVSNIGLPVAGAPPT